jgi:hypothetical protein
VFSKGNYILIDIYESECIDVQKARNTKARPEARFFRYEPSLARFYTSPGWPNTNKRAGLRQKTKHGGLAQHDPFISKPVKPAYFALNRAYRPVLARFFHVYRARPTRLVPQRAGLGQGNEPAGLDNPGQFSTVPSGPGRAGRAVGPSLGECRHGSYFSSHMTVPVFKYLMFKGFSLWMQVLDVEAFRAYFRLVYS